MTAEPAPKRPPRQPRGTGSELLNAVGSELQSEGPEPSCWASRAGSEEDAAGEAELVSPAFQAVCGIGSEAKVQGCEGVRCMHKDAAGLGWHQLQGFARRLQPARFAVAVQPKVLRVYKW